MKEYALIAAGGRSIRLGSELPKQFLELGGKPMIMYGIEAFYRYASAVEIVVVLPETHIPLWEQLQKKHHFSVPHHVVKGGENRVSSVRNGLAALPDDHEALIAVHDGARPFIDEHLIRRLFREARQFGNTVPYVLPTDSVRLQEPNGTSRSLNRAAVRLIQTPQVFELSFLKRAYEDIKDAFIFTDDAGLAEHAGAEIHLTEGIRENIKITFKEDLLWAELFLKDRSKHS